MNIADVKTRLIANPNEDFSSIVFSRVFYDHKMPIMHLMSMSEALRQRQGDVINIRMLTKNAAKKLDEINRRR